MDLGFSKLMERMEEFERSHIKRMIPGRRELIKRIYEDFTLIFDECISSIKENDKEIGICITTKNLISCKEGGYCFNQLIYLADITNMSILEDCIVIKLNFHLWEWVKK